MATTNALAATLLSMSGQRNILVIPRPFVAFTGSLEAAMFLNQLLYWMPRGHNDGFIYKTDQEWQDELCLSRYAVRKARDRLIEMGFLETKVTRSGVAPTVHYYLDYDKLTDIWAEWLKEQDRLSEIEQSDCLKSNNRLSEIEQTIVRKRTNMNHRVPTETTTKIPPPPTPLPPTAENGGGGGSEKTDLYYWLLEHGVNSAEAAERNQHHDMAATQAFYRRTIGSLKGDERAKRIGSFIRTLDRSGPPPLPAPTTNGHTPAPLFDDSDANTPDELARKLKAYKDGKDFTRRP